MPGRVSATKSPKVITTELANQDPFNSSDSNAPTIAC